MKVKGVNEILGYIYFVLGVVKGIFIFTILLKTITYIQLVFNGSSAVFDIYKYSKFSIILGGVELALGVIAIIMIILNITKEPQVIKSYLMNICAVLIQLIDFSTILTIICTIGACGIYMKQGSKIVKLNKGEIAKYSKVSKQMNDTDWFYKE